VHLIKDLLRGTPFDIAKGAPGDEGSVEACMIRADSPVALNLEAIKHLEKQGFRVVHLNEPKQPVKGETNDPSH
jgi:hypothetical protein